MFNCTIQYEGGNSLCGARNDAGIICQGIIADCMSCYISTCHQISM